jgi:hypothetical protein
MFVGFGMWSLCHGYTQLRVFFELACCINQFTFCSLLANMPRAQMRSTRLRSRFILESHKVTTMLIMLSSNVVCIECRQKLELEDNTRYP